MTGYNGNNYGYNGDYNFPNNGYSGYGSINKTETQYNFSGQFVARIENNNIIDTITGNKLGVTSEEFSELENAYFSACDKRDEFYNMLVDNGILEKEYSPEELAEIERKQDREKIEALTKAVSELIEKNKVDSKKIDELTKDSKCNAKDKDNKSSVKARKSQTSTPTIIEEVEGD